MIGVVGFLAVAIQQHYSVLLTLAGAAASGFTLVCAAQVLSFLKTLVDLSQFRLERSQMRLAIQKLKLEIAQLQIDLDRSTIERTRLEVELGLQQQKLEAMTSWIYLPTSEEVQAYGRADFTNQQLNPLSKRIIGNRFGLLIALIAISGTTLFQEAVRLDERRAAAYLSDHLQSSARIPRSSAFWIEGLPRTANITAESITPFEGPVSLRAGMLPRQNYVGSEETLKYTFSFENISSDVTARWVVITGVLDPNVDISTLHLLTPGATVDNSKRTLTWSLLNTGLGVDGFRKIAFTARLKPNLITGTEIRNRTTITYKTTEIDAQEWTGAIDATPPVSAVSAIRPKPGETSFAVSWFGSDVGAGVSSYDVYVSDNHAPFKLWLTDTKARSAFFDGRAGHSYGFYSIARDLVGNVETMKTIADADTFIPAIIGTSNGDRIIAFDYNAVTGKQVGQSGFNERVHFVENGKIASVKNRSNVKESTPHLKKRLSPKCNPSLPRLVLPRRPKLPGLSSSRREYYCF